MVLDFTSADTQKGRRLRESLLAVSGLCYGSIPLHNLGIMPRSLTKWLCFVQGNGLVSMSTAWSSVGHHWMLICFEVMTSWIKWCRTLMCFMRELTSAVLVASAMALWLSHHIVVGESGLELRSVRILHSQIASWAAHVELTYSTSIDDSVGVAWALLLQVITAPANMNMYLSGPCCDESTKQM
jgi:hypothetical protein